MNLAMTLILTLTVPLTVPAFVLTLSTRLHLPYPAHHPPYYVQAIRVYACPIPPPPMYTSPSLLCSGDRADGLLRAGPTGTGALWGALWEGLWGGLWGGLWLGLGLVLGCRFPQQAASCQATLAYAYCYLYQILALSPLSTPGNPDAPHARRPPTENREPCAGIPAPNPKA